MNHVNPVIEMYAEETVNVKRLEDKIKYLQMEVDLCHLWLDAAEVPRYETGYHGSKKIRKSLLSRLAIFMARWVDMGNYMTLMDNIDELLRDPSGKNLHLVELNDSIEESE